MKLHKKIFAKSVAVMVATLFSGSMMAATITIGSGSNAVSFSDSGTVSNTVDIYANGSYSTSPTTTSSSANYLMTELNIGSSDKTLSFNLIDTNPEDKTVNYYLYLDNDYNSGSYLLDQSSVIHFTDADNNNLTNALSGFLADANKDYILVAIAKLNGSLGTGETNRLVSTSISAVPLPGAVWLFGSALLGFIGFANRRKV